MHDKDQNKDCNQRRKNGDSGRQVIEAIRCGEKSRLSFHTRMQPTPFVTTPLI
jgi:hypothetical protein